MEQRMLRRWLSGVRQPAALPTAIDWCHRFLFLSVSPPHTHPHLSCASFIAAITVVAWASFIQVESKILEKQGDNSVGSREAFRKKTTSVFAASVVLFGVSVAAFVYSFSIIGYIKPCASRHYLSPQLQQQH